MVRSVLPKSERESRRFSIDPLASRIEIDRAPIVQWSAIALLIVGGLVLETTVFSAWRIFGVAPTFGYVAVAAVGYYAGANTGFVFGFFAGLGADIFYRTPLGVSAISMLVCGLVIGIVQTGMIRPTAIAVPIMGFLVSIAGNSLYVLLSILLGFEDLFSLHTGYVILVTSLISMVASPFIFALVKKIIGAPAWKNR